MMYYWSDHIKKNKTFLTCGVYVREERCNLKERNQFVDLGVNVRIIKNGSLKSSLGKEWIRFIWLKTGTTNSLLRTPVNNLLVSISCREFLY